MALPTKGEQGMLEFSFGNATTKHIQTKQTPPPRDSIKKLEKLQNDQHITLVTYTT